MAYPATPKTWVAGDVLTAAQLNAELRDALLGAFPLGPPDVAWTSWTPTVTQGVSVTVTNTRSRYTRVGRLIVASWELAVTGAGTPGSGVTVSLPVTAATANYVAAGTLLLTDASAADGFTAFVDLATTTTMQFSSTRANGLLGAASFTAGLAAADTLKGTVTYESAT
jgi:hypothetical protein